MILTGIALRIAPLTHSGGEGYIVLAVSSGVSSGVSLGVSLGASLGLSSPSSKT